VMISNITLSSHFSTFLIMMGHLLPNAFQSYNEI
jgi:hypothetical protein